MMVVDASAVVAILLEEPELDVFLSRLAENPAVLSPIGYWEAHTRLFTLKGDEGVARLDRLLSHFNIQIAPATEQTVRFAVEAQRRFGKRTSAKLNLGDCFAYALARERNAPLLYKGEDFAETDVASALSL